MICGNCGNEHDGSFGSGRFCCMRCSRAFSTKSKRQEINDKVSQKLTGRTISDSHRESLKEGWKKTPVRRWKEKLDLQDLFVKGTKKVNNQHLKLRLISEGIKSDACECCGTGPTYNGRPLTLQVHHVNGDNTDNRIDNLQILCPNCHSQTENYSGKSSSRRISSTE